MSAIVTRLRIAGFKSFAEPTTIDILPGLTGIVGPNGCGKSNVVEALRWAMGETSARSLRGGEMDEVIFAGSAARPSRNIAEVTVTLDEATGLAPPPLQGETELQISRQIERGSGSTYRVNGREMRARDVHTIFADIASGARSSAMVSQGRVAFLVDARPDERRSVLEEAAGITGLHARRSEAELRLRAAAANLARLADLRAQLAEQHAGLSEQAVAARAYRAAVTALAEAERRLLGVLLGRAARAKLESSRAAASAREDLLVAEREAEAAAAAERAAEAAAVEGSAALSIAAATLERARAAFETADADQARAAEAAERAAVRLAEVTSDHEVAVGQVDEASMSTTALAREAETLRRFLDAFDDRHAALLASGASASALVKHQADRHEARARADRELASLEATRLSLATRIDAIERTLEEMRVLAPAERVVQDAAASVMAAERRLSEARASLAAAEAALRTALDALASFEREDAALRDGLSRASARLEAARRRSDGIATEHRAISARRSAAMARVAPGSVERIAQTATAARHAADVASGELHRAERVRQDAEAARALTRTAAEAAGARSRENGARLERERAERERLEAQLACLAADHESVCEDLVAPSALAAARDALASAVCAVDLARQQASVAEREREEAAAAAAAARAEIVERDAACRAATAEMEALSSVTGDDEMSLLDAMRVPQSLEASVAAGLGEALAASLEPEAARFWRVLGPLEPCPALPAGAVPLAHLLQAPAALTRVLSQVGLLDSDADGHELQASLSPGQILVTLEGGSFRWDGHVARAGQKSQVTERLRARRRIEDCRAVITEAEAALPHLRAAMDEAIARGAGCEGTLQAARSAIAAGEHAVSAASALQTDLSARDATARARAGAVGAELSRVAAVLEDARLREREAFAASVEVKAAAAARLAEDAEIEAEAAIAAEQQARQAARAAEARMIATEEEARSVAALQEEAVTLLAMLDPALVRLGEELAATGAELDDAQAEAAAVAAATSAHEDRRPMIVSEAERARSTEVDCRSARQQAELAIEEARARHADLARRAREADATQSRLAPEQAELLRERALLDERLAELRASCSSLCTAAGELAEARRREEAARLELATLEAQGVQARDRMASIEAETPRAHRRLQERSARAAALAARLDETRREHAALLAMPSIAAERRRTAETAFAAAESARAAATARALDAQVALTARRDARRNADLAIADAREACSRRAAAEAQASVAAAEIEARVRDEGGTIEAGVGATAAAEAEARRVVARSLRTRDEIGPVNLLAEREADQVGARLAALSQEASELEEAVARLRGSIGHLNREGRERLSASFVQIDAQFRALFGRMFDGGRAHLALVGSDDPLEAGLEIYAQPPGKKLATLSLLSGGEQALTALSLIFAAFRCNPAPVCVLDEVDAPLDDANVERFCRLVSDLAKETATRFLVVTHHQLTMANMDRLYGVTMQERGVSRLLSVDLGRAVEMTEVYSGQ